MNNLNTDGDLHMYLRDLSTSTQFLDPVNYKIQYDLLEKTWPETCQTGEKQSPIQLPIMFSKLNQTSIMEVLSFNYSESFGGISLQQETSAVDKTNSNFMYLNASSNGYVIVRKNKVEYRYNISHVAFVYPPEHILEDRLADLEMQMVHIKDTTYKTLGDFIPDPDAAFEKLIISVLFEALAPDTNPNIFNLRVSTVGSVDTFNLSLYPPVNQSFLFYEGSLTKPPCSEDVNWVVNVQKELFTKQQLEDFAGWFIDSGYKTKGNARSLKPINNRTIYYHFRPSLEEYTSSFLIRSFCCLVFLIYIILI